MPRRCERVSAGRCAVGSAQEERGVRGVQVVITPCEKYMPESNEAIAAEMHRQIQKLFPSAAGLEPTWHSVVKIQQSLYRCARRSSFVHYGNCCVAADAWSPAVCTTAGAALGECKASAEALPQTPVGALCAG